MIDPISGSGCKLCDNDHGNIVCNCGHSHSQHVFAAGCAVKYSEGKRCLCDRYSQTELKKAK